MWSEIVTSLCCYASTFVLCLVLRLLLRRTLPRAYHQYALEFVDTFHMVCCLFENGMVLKLGIVPWAVALFTLTIIYAFLLEGFGNPAVVLDYVWRGKISAVSGGVQVVIELAAAIAAYRYTTFMWMTLAPSPRHYHAAKVEMIAENCSTGLNVSPLVGFAVEMTSMAFLTIVAGYFHGGRKFWRIINAVISVTVIICGLNYTGALMNPVLGFASGWGCKDHWIPSHLFVYWLGPFLGIMLGNWTVDNFMAEKVKKSSTMNGKNGAVAEQNGNHEKIQ